MQEETKNIDDAEEASVVNEEVKEAVYLEFVGDEETAERLKKLQQRLVNIDDCAKLINLALAKKYKLYMSHFENVAADVDCYDNKITLSPHLSDEELTYALLHSLRHVWQLDKDMPDFSKLNIFSYMMLNRILEADASAYACKMLWDLKEKEGSNSEWNLWLDRNNLFVKYQEEILKENENKTKEALKTAFLAWFTDDDAKDKYDYNYIKDSLENIGEAMSDFSTDVAVDDILKMFCVDLGDDVNYIDDKDFTNESAHIDMNEETFNFVKSWFNKRYYLNNTEIDASLDKIIKRKMLWQTSGSVGIGEEIISPEVDMIIEGDDKEKSLLARAINRICKSPVGIGIIKDVALAKYAFRLDDEIKDRFKINLGAKKISFAKGYNEEILMIDMIKASRLALSSEIAEKDFHKETNVANAIMTEKVVEADAIAQTMEACFELAASGDEPPCILFSYENKFISKAYEGAVIDGGAEAKDSGAAAMEAFAAWFEEDAISGKSDEFIEKVCQKLHESTLVVIKALSGVLTMNNLVKRICRFADGRNYGAASPKALEKVNAREVPSHGLEYARKVLINPRSQQKGKEARANRREHEAGRKSAQKTKQVLVMKTKYSNGRGDSVQRVGVVRSGGARGRGAEGLSKGGRGASAPAGRGGGGRGG